MKNSLIEKNKANLQMNSEENNDREDFTKLNNKEVMKLQQDKIKKQDDMLDEFHGLLINAKRSNQEISNEIKTHTPMLSNLERQMDNTHGKIKRTENKLNQYFDKSSNGCLMTIICIEIVVMLIIILGL